MVLVPIVALPFCVLKVSNTVGCGIERCMNIRPLQSFSAGYRQVSITKAYTFYLQGCNVRQQRSDMPVFLSLFAR
jgi:hypothetical protein